MPQYPTEDELRTLFREMDDVFYRTDREGRIVLVSPSITSMLGYSVDELLGEKVDTLCWEPDEQSKIVEALTAGNGKVVTCEIRAGHRDGRSVWISVNVRDWYAPDGTLLGVEGMARDVSAWRMTEERMRQCEHLLSSTDDLIALLDRRFRYLKVNEAYARAFCKDRQEIVGCFVADLIGNEMFIDTVKGHLERCLAGEIVHYQAWFNFPDGRRRYKDVTYYPCKNVQGEIVAISSTVHDVTEIHLAEKARELQGRQLQGILDALRDCVYVINGDYGIEYINASLKTLFGPADGRKCYEYLNNRVTPCPWCCLEKVLAGQSCSRQWKSGKNGHHYEVNESPIILHDGRTAKVTVFHDIQQRLADEHELRRNVYLFESITNNTPAVIYLKQASGEYLYANNRFRSLFLGHAADIKGKTDFDIFPEAVARQFQENDQKALRGGVVLEIEEVVFQGEGVHTYLSIKVPLFDEAGVPWGLAGISTDITERKRLAGELEEKNEQLLSLINATPDVITFKDGEGRWLLANDAVLSLFELAGVDYVGKTDRELARFSNFYGDAFLICEGTDEEAWVRGRLSRADEVIPMPQGPARTYDVIKAPLFHADGSRKALVVLGRDVTSRVEVEAALRREMGAHEESLRELAEKNKAIKEANIALRVLLDQHGQTRQGVEELVLLQLEKFITPYLTLLRAKAREAEVKDYVDIIVRHFASVTDSFVQKLNAPGLGLTDREMLVADLVRQGKTTQDIARILGLAYRTVEAYRNSLRNKLKINNKKINLHQYLVSRFSPKS